jgi:isoleucyl-tRNA synthetase
MSTTNETTLHLSIEALQERWEMLRLISNISRYHITENFSTGIKTYEVSDLKMLLVGDYALCSDRDNYICNHHCSLMMFMRNHLTDIEVIPYVQEKLEFGNIGVIYVDVIK